MNQCTYAEILSASATILSLVAVMLGMANMLLVRRLGYKII